MSTAHVGQETGREKRKEALNRAVIEKIPVKQPCAVTGEGDTRTLDCARCFADEEHTDGIAGSRGRIKNFFLGQLRTVFSSCCCKKAEEIQLTAFCICNFEAGIGGSLNRFRLG